MRGPVEIKIAEIMVEIVFCRFVHFGPVIDFFLNVFYSFIEYGYMDHLIQEHGQQGNLISLEDSWQMCTRSEFYDYLIRIAKAPKKYTLTDTLLETLSIIAYKQPVTRLDVEKIRGVNCDHAINRLVEYNLVEELGRLDAPGRPLLFGTTEQFLRSFGVGSLEELPELSAVQVEEFKEQAEQEAVLQLQT